MEDSLSGKHEVAIRLEDCVIHPQYVLVRPELDKVSFIYTYHHQVIKLSYRYITI